MSSTGFQSAILSNTSNIVFATSFRHYTQDPTFAQDFSILWKNADRKWQLWGEDPENAPFFLNRDVDKFASFDYHCA